MRKGFTVTLLTVAVAMMGSNAMSMAPVISNIKDIIVADDSGASDANIFVYPDAIDLNTVVSDGDTPDSDIIWTYYDEDGNYLINAKPSLPGGNDGLTPPAANIIAGPGATASDDPDAVDSDLFTITVRNSTLSPIGGPNSDPAGTGIIPSMTDTVLFFASDGDQVTSGGTTIYTEDDGTDRLSPAGGIEVYNVDFSTGVNGWFAQVILTANGGTASTSQSANGLCLTVSAAGDNVANWTSEYGDLDLVDNAVYELRATLNTTQTGEDQIPLWELGLINLDVTGANIAANSYGANFWFLDNLGNINDDLGGSQGIGNFRNEFVMYWTPLSVSLPSWRSTTTGAFQAASDPFNDAQLSFRVFDIGSSGFGASNDSGTICLQELRIYRHDLDALTITTPADYEDLSIASGDVTAGGTGTSVAFAGGAVTLTPASGTGWENGQIDIVPGTGTIDGVGGPQPAESWPLTWPSDVLYLMTVNASIPDASVQTSGVPDLFMIQLEGHTQTYQQSYVLPNIKFNGQGAGGAAMPPVAPALGEYKAFGYTNETSKATGFYEGLRPHISFANQTAILPSPSTGAISIHGISVNRCTF